MNILLVSPHFPDSFWSFKHALRFISKKAAEPPLGLITVSAMLPAGWHKKLVDMNVNTLVMRDIDWADLVFISAMQIQKESVNRVINMCVARGRRIVAGGPLFTNDYQDFPLVDHLVLNEAEITLPHFLKDLSEGHPEKIYRTAGFPDIKTYGYHYHKVFGLIR